MGELLAIEIADHIVSEGDVALPREGDAARRSRKDLVVGQSPAPGMAVRVEDRRQRATAPERPVEVAGDEEARQALEINLLDAIASPVPTARRTPGAAASAPVAARGPR